MRHILVVVASLVIVASASVAQPGHGDLVVTVAGGRVPYLATVNPAQSSRLTTLIAGGARCRFDWVRMAADNRRLLVGELDTSGSSLVARMLYVGTTGAASTFVSLPGFTSEGGAELDYDGRWVFATRVPGPFFADGHLLGLSASGSVQTFARLHGHGFEDVVIDREPGRPPYAVIARGAGGPPPNFGYSHLLSADRVGNLSTIIAKNFHAKPLELNAATGEYLSCTTRLVRVDHYGRVATIANFDYAGVAARVGQDDRVWVASRSILRPSVLHFDVKQQVVVTITPILLGAGEYISGLEVYGARRLACVGSGQPGTTVAVHLQSRKAGDGGKPYLLACSTRRRPGIRFANGERLDLDVTDPLFLVSARGLAPSIFRGFQGVTDAAGNATAGVVLPASLPRSLRFAVFVAGVIYDSGGIRTVANTHWFFLA